jgi:transposase
MIAFPVGVRVWLATGHTDMRRGFDGLALLVQEQLKRDPHSGQLFVFGGRRGGLIKILWHDGQGLCLLAKRLERGRFIWPSASAGAVNKFTHARPVHDACDGSLRRDESVTFMQHMAEIVRSAAIGSILCICPSSC